MGRQKKDGYWRRGGMKGGCQSGAVLPSSHRRARPSTLAQARPGDGAAVNRAGCRALPEQRMASLLLAPGDTREALDLDADEGELPMPETRCVTIPYGGRGTR